MRRREGGLEPWAAGSAAAKDDEVKRAGVRPLDAEYPDGEAGSGEGLSPDDRLRQPEVHAESAHLVGLGLGSGPG